MKSPVNVGTTHLQTAQQRARLALRSLSDPRARIEVREADPKTPDRAWQRAAMGFVAATMVLSAGAVMLSRTTKDTVESFKGGRSQVEKGRSASGSIDNGNPYAGLKTVNVVMNGERMKMLTPMEQIRLSKHAAAEHQIGKVGLDWKDIFAVIHTESGWVARDGMGRNGKVSRGLGQFEDATASALGIDAQDPRQAVAGVAKLLKEGAQWSHTQGHHLRSGALSVFYNLSTRARNAWDGNGTEELPYATRRHIQEMGKGRQLASKLETTWNKEQIIMTNKIHVLNRHVPQVLAQSRMAQTASLAKGKAANLTATAIKGGVGVAGSGVAKVTKVGSIAGGKTGSGGAIGASTDGRRIAESTGQNQRMKGIVASALAGQHSSAVEDTQSQRDAAASRRSERERVQEHFRASTRTGAIHVPKHVDPALLRMSALALIQRIKGLPSPVEQERQQAQQLSHNDDGAMAQGDANRRRSETAGRSGERPQERVHDRLQARAHPEQGARMQGDNRLVQRDQHDPRDQRPPVVNPNSPYEVRRMHGMGYEVHHALQSPHERQVHSHERVNVVKRMDERHDRLVHQHVDEKAKDRQYPRERMV